MQSVINQFRKIHFNSSDFQQISSLVPYWTMKFYKICTKNFIIQNSVNNVSKTLSFIKIHPLELDISSIECQKTPEIEFTHFSTFN